MTISSSLITSHASRRSGKHRGDPCGALPIRSGASPGANWHSPQTEEFSFGTFGENTSGIDTYGAKSWNRERRVAARIEASKLGIDIRYVVTSLTEGSADHIYDTLYCARGQAENLIKLHKTQLASDRTSCRSANANQMRLILHTAAYWLLWRVQQTIPKTAALAKAEFTTLRLRLLKVAARVMDSANRIRVAFASACPDADLLRAIVLALKPAPI